MAEESTQVEDSGTAEQVELITLDQVFEVEETKETGEKAEAQPEPEPEEVEAEAEASSEDEERPEAQERDEKGRFKSKDSDSTPESEKDEEPWHVKAVTTERQKRQAAEKEAEELRKKLEADAKETEKTSVFEDEAKFRNELYQEFDQARLNDRLNMSQFFAEKEFGAEAVKQKAEVFKELAANNPELRDRFLQAGSPYHEMVSIVDKHQELESMKDIDSYKERLKAEVRAELEKEFEGKKAAEAKKREAVKPSLASSRSAGGVKENTELIGLDDVFET